MLYSFFFFLMYGSSCIGMQYLNIYYKSIGISSVEITVIIIVSTACSIISSLGFGYLFDRSKRKNLIFLCIIIGSLISFSTINFLENYKLILIVNTIFSLFYNSLQPLFTTITLENIKNKCLKFGQIRIWGTVGYCITSLLLPQLQFNRSIFIVFFIYLNTMLILFYIIVRKDSVNKVVKDKTQYKIKEILKEKTILKIILYVCLINMTIGAYFNFFGIYYTEDLGYSKEKFGILCAVSTLAEIPFLLLSNRIYNKIKIDKVLIIAGFITAIRWFLCAVFTDSIVLIFIQLLHGFGFIVLMTSVNIYITNHCNKSYIGSLQSLFFITTLFSSKIFGSIIGGVLPRYLPQSNIFIINSIICIISIFAFIKITKKNKIKEICV